VRGGKGMSGDKAYFRFLFCLEMRFRGWRKKRGKKRRRRGGVSKRERGQRKREKRREGILGELESTEVVRNERDLL